MVRQFVIFACLSACTATVFSQLVKDELDNTDYVPTRKGEKPPCYVRPGETFCENVPDYPYKLILQALKKTKFDVSKFLVDETMDEGPNFSYLNYDQKLLGQFTDAKQIMQETRNKNLALSNFNSKIPSSLTSSRSSDPYEQTAPEFPTAATDYTSNPYRTIRRYLKMPYSV